MTALPALPDSAVLIPFPDVNRARFNIRTVLFDWDGTLLDSYAADMRAYVAMFRALEIDWNPEQIERHYSPDWYQVYRAARVPTNRWAEADKIWRAAYADERPALLPGARSVLRALERKFSMGLVTSGSRARVEGQIRRFGFQRLFSARVFGEDTRRKKPDAAPLRLALAPPSRRSGRMRLRRRHSRGRPDGSQRRHAHHRRARPVSLRPPHARRPAGRASALYSRTARASGMNSGGSLTRPYGFGMMDAAGAAARRRIRWSAASGGCPASANSA